MIDQGRGAEAMVHLRAALAVLTEELGPDHRLTELARAWIVEAEDGPTAVR